MAEFLREGRPEVGIRPYASTQSGNFDLYLPFIEKGLTLLNEHGRLGYIAPSLWVTNEYGQGLRSFIAAGRNLDRWIDFKSYQVFDEATNYTALQFFTKAPNKTIRVAEAPTGDIPDDPWGGVGRALVYGRQEFGERWLLLTGEARALIDRLYQSCKRLDNPKHTSSIFVGIQTSADAIYHLTRLGPSRYLCTPRGERADPPYEVEIEDALMKPLISGAETKRYVTPETNTHLLFPYVISDNGARLIDKTTMQNQYRKAWMYLLSYETVLRARENGKMDDDHNWWGYNYPKNLDKQEIVKLVIPRLVNDFACSVDDTGSVYLDNVDVGGVVITDGEERFFISGVLNSPTTNFVFKRISKPFRGGYFSANKQFIAPLPIPPASPFDRADVAARAKALQAAHTARRDTLVKIQRRLSATRQRNKPETWLFAGLKTKRELAAAAPAPLDAEDKQKWAEQRYSLDLAAYHDAIKVRLRPGAPLAVSFADGELSFAIDGVPVIDRVFVGDAEGVFIAAQWRVVAATFTVTEGTEGKKLAEALRKLAVADNPALVQQIIALEGELSALDANIARQEAEMNALVNRLYGLTEAEKILVEKGLKAYQSEERTSPLTRSLPPGRRQRTRYSDQQLEQMRSDAQSPQPNVAESR